MILIWGKRKLAARSFNTKNQLIRLIAFPFVCALIAWITLLIGR